MTLANTNQRQRAMRGDSEGASQPVPVTQAATSGVVIKRTFNAVPELVFKAWSDPLQVAQWFGPCEVNMAVRELDVRPGGTLRMEGHCDAGSNVRIEGQYREVEEPDWIVYADACFVGEALICETLATVTFHEIEGDGKTRVTIHCEPLLGFDAFAQRRWLEGWSASLDRLAKHLAAPLPEQICT
ncbi:MAG: hypothetical protein JWL63_1020 [Rhodocyclales bacterium]|nr:hypothetical protein [Rhodocyclales bacterium]